MTPVERTLSVLPPALGDEAAEGDNDKAEREICLAEIRKDTGKTTEEVAAAAGLGFMTLSRRLAELREAGLVKTGRPRICSVTGRLTFTWFSEDEVRS